MSVDGCRCDKVLDPSIFYANSHNSWEEKRKYIPEAKYRRNHLLKCGVQTKISTKRYIADKATRRDTVVKYWEVIIEMLRDLGQVSTCISETKDERTYRQQMRGTKCDWHPHRSSRSQSCLERKRHRRRLGH